MLRRRQQFRTIEAQPILSKPGGCSEVDARFNGNRQILGPLPELAEKVTALLTALDTLVEGRGHDAGLGSINGPGHKQR